jgi:hypothetical protein
MHDVSHSVHTPPQGFLRNYVFSLDHKVIGKQYYGMGLLAVLIGMALSWLMRIHLVWPNFAIPGLQWLSSAGAPGGVITPEYYLQLMTMHGTLMVFFVLTNVPFAGFGNYFLPIQIGAEDMAFPRFNMMSFWVTFVGFCVLLAAFFVGDGPPLSGWTAYAPLSALPGTGPGQAMGPNFVGDFDRHFLYRAAARFSELHYNHARFAYQGHDADAHATLHVGMVYYVLHRALGIRSPAPGLHFADSGSRGWYQLLRSFEPCCQRSDGKSLRRITTSLATPVLVLRASRGLHRDLASGGNCFAHSGQQLPATAAQP